MNRLPAPVEHVEAVLAPEVESIGTVEGNLEGLIIHGKRRFLIFDAHWTSDHVLFHRARRMGNGTEGVRQARGGLGVSALAAIR
jgi:hypothetical protein